MFELLFLIQTVAKELNKRKQNRKKKKERRSTWPHRAAQPAQLPHQRGPAHLPPLVLFFLCQKAEARRGARPSAPATSCFTLEAALRSNSRHDDAPCPLSPFPHSLHPLSLFCLSPSLIPGCTETADERHRSHQHPHAQPVRPRAPPWIREALPRRTRRRVP